MRYNYNRTLSNAVRESSLRYIVPASSEKSASHILHHPMIFHALTTEIRALNPIFIGLHIPTSPLAARISSYQCQTHLLPQTLPGSARSLCRIPLVPKVLVHVQRILEQLILTNLPSNPRYGQLRTILASKPIHFLLIEILYPLEYDSSREARISVCIVRSSGNTAWYLSVWGDMCFRRVNFAVDDEVLAHGECGTPADIPFVEEPSLSPGRLGEW